MKTIFLCLSKSFDVNYVINPWMEGNFHKVSHTIAVRQWTELRNALVAAGANVVVLPQPPEDCPDAVFTANAGLVYRGAFIPSRFRHNERTAEEPFFINWFMDRGYKISPPCVNASREHLSFEGAGDALFSSDRKNLWMGFGFRTSLSFKPFLEDDLERAGCDSTVRPLQLIDPRFYHLDTCFCPLDTGELLWYPDAFDMHSRYVIELWYKDKAIAVHEADAIKFACNSISVGEKLITPIITPYLAHVLKTRGYDVYQVDMSQYLRSGGAAKCLTLEDVE